VYGRPPGIEIGYIAAPKAISLLVWINPGQVRSKQPVFFEPSACKKCCFKITRLKIL